MHPSDFLSGKIWRACFNQFLAKFYVKAVSLNLKLQFVVTRSLDWN